ncbi:hypothetical protein [Polyangium spumosum]|uniref:Uncharacterized protein n=1 Tax=Polyangium spumosum TaxID=889282 RepID=A0A6N7PGU2_9BACT|nr:hypothetical protein [Polyangium spumosum]MRG91219.1 hypothetical protein [Polyangium spumosum]
MRKTRRERSPVFCLGLWLLGLGPGLVACTFPTIDYVEQEVAAEAPCVTTPKCASDIDTCAKQAEGQRTMCMSQCQKGPVDMGLSADCSTCESTHDTALNICVAQCETCSAADGCTNATESCRSLLGLP